MNFPKVKLSTYLFLLLIITTSCLQEPAKIINKNNIKFSKNNKLNQEKYRNISQNKENLQSENIKDLEKPSKQISVSNKDDNDTVIINSGDTLYSISKKNNVALRDLIEHNNLEPPYQVKIGDKIKIPSANYHESREGDTLYSISRMYDMKVNDLIALNNLKFPYSIYPGEKIKITNPKNLKKLDEKASIQKVDNNAKTDLKNDITNLQSATIKPQLININSKNPDLAKSNLPVYKFPQKSPQGKAQDKNAVVNKPVDKNAFSKISDKNNNFYWPIRGEIISHFGPKSAGLYNDGINIKGKDGQPVLSTEDGIVAYVGNELKGYGNLVIIKHAGGWISAYAHLRDYVIKKGQKVSRGQKIGAVGNSGKVKSSQLYFSLRKGRDAVNPEKYLNY